MWDSVIALVGNAIADYPVLVACMVSLVFAYLLHAMLSLIGKVFHL